ncbi:BrnT family toxin [Cupriavidus sp. UYPR2.512]|nr:BrnT family toxin [Cupriavidus necator]
MAYGPIGPRLYCLVFTIRGETLRAISLRKANSREVRDYEQEI